MTKQEKEVITCMRHGAEPRARLVMRLIGLAVATVLIGVGYLLGTVATRSGLTEPTMLTLTIGVGIALLAAKVTEYRVDRALLVWLKQWNERNYERGKAVVSPHITWGERLRRFWPTAVEWRWWLAAWIALNLLDILSTRLALPLGAMEANPSARTEFESGAHLQFDLIKMGVTMGLALVFCLFKRKEALRLITVLMGLVVLSNFVVYGAYSIQPELAMPDRVPPSEAVFGLGIAELAVVAAMILWARKRNFERLRDGTVKRYRKLRYGEWQPTTHQS